MFFGSFDIFTHVLKMFLWKCNKHVFFVFFYLQINVFNICDIKSACSKQT